MVDPTKPKRALTISNKQNNLFTHIHVVASNRPALLGGVLHELITWQLGIIKAVFVNSATHCWFSLLVEDTMQGGKVMSQLVPGMIAALRTTISRKGELPEDLCVSLATATPSTTKLRTCYVEVVPSAMSRGVDCSVIKVVMAGLVDTPLLREVCNYVAVELKLTPLAGKAEFNGSGSHGLVLCIQAGGSALSSEQCSFLQESLQSRLDSLEASFLLRDRSGVETPGAAMRTEWLESLTTMTLNILLELQTRGQPQAGSISLLPEADLTRHGSTGSLKSMSGSTSGSAGAMSMLTTYPQSNNEQLGTGGSSFKGLGLMKSSSSSSNLLRQLAQIQGGSPGSASPGMSPRGALKPSSTNSPPVAAQFNSLKLGGGNNGFRNSSPNSSPTKELSAAESSLLLYPNHAWHKAPWVTDPSRKLTIADFELHCKLGSGMTSKVYLAKLRGASDFAPGADDRVVLKVMPKTQVIDMGHRVGELVVAERSVMELVQGSRHILCLFGHFQDDWALFMVTGLAVCDFFHLMTHHFGTRNYWRSSKLYAAQILLGVEHMHSRGLLYRDLKPENMLVKEDGSLIIADFGMSVRLKPSERAHSICGTAEYMCPEMVTQKGYTFLGELWAYGIFLYELLTGTTPFEKQSDDEESSAVLKKIRNHTSITFPPGTNVDSEAKSLIRALLTRDEKQRIGAQDKVGHYASIRTHPWFREINWKDVESGKARPLINMSQQFPKNVDIRKGQPLPWEHGHQVNFTSGKMFETF